MRRLLPLIVLLLVAGARTHAGAAHPHAGTMARPAPSDLLVATTVTPTLTSAGQSSLWRLNTEDQAVLLLRRQGTGSLDAPAWSPDHTHIAYVVDGQALWQMSAGGTGARRLYALAADPFSRISAPRYTPDGRSITFTAGCCASFGIYRIDVDGTRLHRLLDGGVRFLQDWSPDGRTLLFTLDGALWTADAQGGHARAVGGDAPGAGSFFDARYAPDGSHLVATLAPTPGAREGAGREVVLLHPDGRYLTVLSGAMPFDAGQPAWSPDGKAVAFIAASGALGALGRLHDVWIMRYNGAKKQNLTVGKLGDVEAVAWAR